MTSLFIGGLGLTEILLIIILVVVLFGGKKIPELMRGLGRGVKEFKDAMKKDYDSEEEKKEKNDKPETK